MSELKVEREEQGHRASVFITQGGKRVAEMTFSRVNEKKFIIDHTEVDDSLRGQGAGRKRAGQSQRQLRAADAAAQRQHSGFRLFT